MLQTDYQQLLPDTVINAIESLGYWSDSRILPLNSYENRVYQVGIEHDSPIDTKGVPIIAKFYRPLRWSDEQIEEEHQFTQELFDLDIPVVPPMKFDGKTLLNFNGYRFSLYPRRGGQAPELDNGDHLEVIGRFLGRIHSLGKHQAFSHRPSITIKNYAKDSRAFLLENNFIPTSLIPAYESISQHLIDKIEPIITQTPFKQIRLHGDCHPGNILWRDDHAHFVDFDDARNGPAIQDLWMLLSGEYHQRNLQIADILEGYCEFNDFNPIELQLIEPLRAMRILHYSAWLARRWEDPAFKHNFTWFNSERYWAEHVLTLREQLATLGEPVLQLL